MIHKTAIIDVKSKIDQNVEIGPYTVIGPDVEIQEGTKIQSHVSIIGRTKIGKTTRFIHLLQLEMIRKILNIKEKKLSL